MLSTWKGLSVLRPTLINDILCMYDILSSYLIEQARVHLESGNGSRLADGQRIYTTFSRRTICIWLRVGLLWLLIVLQCPCPCAKR